MPKIKKFLDKKSSVTFHLVHRSQRDPLVVDENAPQHVLLQAAQKPTKGEHKKEELRKWGVFFDDDYDYLQHLREGEGRMDWEKTDGTNAQKHPSVPVVEKHKLQLPSSVFESDVQEDEGMLRKAAPRPGPRPDLDPDIVAGLEDDFDYEDPNNMLEDDFISKAMAAECDPDHDLSYESDSSGSFENSYSEEDEMDDELRSLDGGQFTFRDEETKSRFTEYSMSSSVIHRNNQLSLLDSRFEKMYENYDDTEIGALDCDDIEGNVASNADILLQYADEFEKDKEKALLDHDKEVERLARLQEESNSEDELVPFAVDDPDKDRWDCQSILSTYSNIYNHPKIIEEPKGTGKIKICHKTGLPLDVLGSNDTKLTAKSLAKLNQLSEPNTLKGPKSIAESVLSTLSILSIRPKDETPEERSDRKKLLKEYRQERRIEKKANVEAFKEERLRQEKIRKNNKNNIQGNKIM